MGYVLLFVLGKSVKMRPALTFSTLKGKAFPASIDVFGDGDLMTSAVRASIDRLILHVMNRILFPTVHHNPSSFNC